MSKIIDVLNLFPPNLRTQELYIQFSKILETGLEEFYNRTTLEHRSIYDPSSEHYDPKYIISLLGGKNIAELVVSSSEERTSEIENAGFDKSNPLFSLASSEQKDPVDINSVSMIVPGLLDMKGTEKGVKTVLKILGIDFENIILLKERSGCNKASVILKSGARLTLKQLENLESLLTEMSSLCATFTEITNCRDVKAKQMKANSEWDYSVGLHYLDKNIRLDRSKLDRVQGFSVPNTSMVISLCSEDTNKA